MYGISTFLPLLPSRPLLALLALLTDCLSPPGVMGSPEGPPDKVSSGVVVTPGGVARALGTGRKLSTDKERRSLEWARDMTSASKKNRFMRMETLKLRDLGEDERSKIWEKYDR